MSKHFTQLLTLAAALAITGIASATTRGGEVPSTVVQFGDLALNTQAGVARLHARIHAAAKLVCDSIDSRVLGLREQYDICVSDAVRESVAAVGNENLSNYHRNRKVGLFASNRN
ncbi:MAG: UrcA family protein [Pseudomonadota bacterium]